MFLAFAVNESLSAQHTANIDLNQANGTLTMLGNTYGNNMNWTWHINVGQNKPVIFNYTIDTQPTYDNICIYAVNADSTTTLVTTLSGCVSGTVSTAISTGKAVVIFSANGSVCSSYGYDGFSMDFTADVSFSNSDGSSYVSGSSIVNGKLGVGILAPKEKVHINGAIRGNLTGGALKVNTDYGYLELGPQSSIYSQFNTDRPSFYFNKPIYLGTGQMSTYSSNNLSLMTAGTARMTILNSNGNVGIGTATPQNKLEVASLNGDGIRIGKIGDTGNMNVSYDSIASQYNLDFSGYRDVAQDQIGARISAIRLNNYADGNALVQKTGLSFSTNPTGIEVGNTGLVEQMRILPNGNIGIGTKFPKNKLDVNGTIRATEVKVVSVDSFADYVFEKNYNLAKLSEVNDYIRANGHLPNIPSASEVKENGMSLVEMQVKLLQKVEELTMYAIEQEKKIEKLERALKDAKK